MKELDLLLEITKEKNNLQENSNSDRLNQLIAQFFKVATPLEMSDFLNNNNKHLSGKNLTYAITGLFKNKDLKTLEIFFNAFENHIFKNEKEINWNVIFNSMDKSIFSKYGSNLNSNFQEESIHKPSMQLQYLEKFGNINTLFKEEENNFLGKENKSHVNISDDTYEQYAGNYYEYIENNPEKLNYLLSKKLPFSQVKNMFFEAVRKEDTRTIGRILHTKYAYDIAKDSDVHNFFLLETPENDALMYLKKEVLMLVQQLQQTYEIMLQATKEENLKKLQKT